ncbi:hypothetical protein ACTFIR_002215 [Dictyostelium discoideum]
MEFLSTSQSLQISFESQQSEQTQVPIEFDSSQPPQEFEFETTPLNQLSFLKQIDIAASLSFIPAPIGNFTTDNTVTVFPVLVGQQGAFAQQESLLQFPVSLQNINNNNNNNNNNFQLGLVPSSPHSSISSPSTIESNYLSNPSSPCQSTPILESSTPFSQKLMSNEQQQQQQPQNFSFPQKQQQAVDLNEFFGLNSVGGGGHFKACFSPDNSFNLYNDLSPEAKSCFKIFAKKCKPTTEHEVFNKVMNLLNNLTLEEIDLIIKSVSRIEKYDSLIAKVFATEIDANFPSINAKHLLQNLLIKIIDQDRKLVFHLFQLSIDHIHSLKNKCSILSISTPASDSLNFSALLQEDILKDNELHSQFLPQISPQQPVLVLTNYQHNQQQQSPQQSPQQIQQQLYNPHLQVLSQQTNSIPHNIENIEVPKIKLQPNFQATTTTTTTQQQQQQQQQQQNTPLISQLIPESIKPKASNKLANNSNGKKVGSSKKVSKSVFPKGIVTPQYLTILQERFGFTIESLEKASNPNGANYIHSVNGSLALVNTSLVPISGEVSTGRDSKNGVVITVKNYGDYTKLTLEYELVTSNNEVNDEKFSFKKKNLLMVEPGIFYFQYSMNRIDKNEKEVYIRFNLVCEGKVIDSILTPQIRFRNTPSEFDQPNNVQLKTSIADQFRTYGDDHSVHVKFVAIANLFKKGIIPKASKDSSSSSSSTAASSAAPGDSSSDGEGDEQSSTSIKKMKKGKPLEVTLKHSSGFTLVIPQHISKAKPEDIWRFPKSIISQTNTSIKKSDGDIIHFPYSYLVEFSALVPRGNYTITFGYEFVNKKANPIHNFVI